MAEAVAHAEGLHIVHRHECRRHDEVEDPLESYCDSHGCTTDGVGEDLRDEYPADGAPGEHERCRVDHDADHRHERMELEEVDGSHTEGADSHADRTGDEQRLAAPLLYGEHGHEGERDVDDTHDDGLYHRVAHMHRVEDTRSEVEHCVDTHGLLEYGEHDAHEDDHDAEGEELLALYLDGSLDLGESLACLGEAVTSAL